MVAIGTREPQSSESPPVHQNSYDEPDAGPTASGFVDTTDIGAHETEKTLRLEKLLAQRPVKEELVQKNVLKSANNLDPSLQAKQLQLAKNQLEDKLNAGLAHRPQPEELVKAGILTKEQTADLKVVGA